MDPQTPNTGPHPFFDRIRWRDPLSGQAMEPIVTDRTPAGVPISGALKIPGTDQGYPIVDCIARLTPELAHRHQNWLAKLSLTPPSLPVGEVIGFQPEATVDSFGWQWTWNSNMRSEKDLVWRVAERFHVQREEFTGKSILDAGAGAGDQSRWLIQQGADVLSVDLSSAIEVVARKLRMHPGWFGVQGDITVLPLDDNQFDAVYCEGVIQHTRDSVQCVRELLRVTQSSGQILASHYTRQRVRSVRRRLLRKLTLGYYTFLRNQLSRMDRFSLLFLTGALSALSYFPMLGKLLRATGTVLYYDMMPDFKSTWTNTFDYYGNHTFQRFITPQQFWQIFEDAGNTELVFKGDGVVVARKL